MTLYGNFPPNRVSKKSVLEGPLVICYKTVLLKHLPIGLCDMLSKKWMFSVWCGTSEWLHVCFMDRHVKAAVISDHDQLPLP